MANAHFGIPDARSVSEQFETIVLGAQQPACPACHSTKLERLLSVFAVGGKSDSFAASESFGPCGTCGDPVARGPVRWISLWT